MNRDIIVLPGEDEYSTVITTDCSGACGQKKLDVVNVSTQILAYYTARVAFMEILSVRAQPTAYTIANFVKDGYGEIMQGIVKLLKELRLDDLPFIASTETNFDMLQSAVAVSIVGKLKGNIDDQADGLCFACVGSPLVGSEVVESTDKMLSIDMFLSLVDDPKALQLAPVGSKGIANKLNRVFGKTAVSCDVDLNKSAGPSTCIILGYNKKDEEYFASKLQNQFYPIAEL